MDNEPAEQAKIPTYTYEWMNGGQPFDFGPQRVTPYAARASAAHKSGVLKNSLRANDMSGLPPLAVQAIVDSAKEEAALAQGEALMFWSLVQVDPKVKDLGMDAVMQKISLGEYEEMVGVLDRKGKKGPLGK